MPYTMYDDVNLSLIPKDAEVVAGYVNGRWVTFPKLAAEFPHAKHVSIAVTAEANAEVLDVERGDALISQVPNWVRRQLARGVDRPVVYCAVSDAKDVLKVLAYSGIPRRKVRLWTAHYTGHQHFCSAACGFGMPTTADATQYTDKALGRSLDASVVSDTFFVTSAIRRARLRAWILAKRAHGATWAALKRTAQWKTWWRLGGR